MFFLALYLPAQAADFLQGDAAGPGMAAQVNVLRDAGGFTGAELVTTSCPDIVVGPVTTLDRAANPAATVAGSVLSTVFFVDPGAGVIDCTVSIDGVALAPLSASLDNVFHIVTPAAAPVDGGINDMDGVADGTITLASSLRTIGGTLVLDGLSVPAGVTLVFDNGDPDATTDGNESYLPVILLVDGAVTIDGTVSLEGADGDSAAAYLASDGGNGGPGGGGGGVGSNCTGAAVYVPGDGFTGGGGTATGTCIDFTAGGIGAVEGPDGEAGGEGVFTDVENGALGYAGGVGGGTGAPWGTGGLGGYCCGDAGDGGYGGGGGNGHSDSSGWGGGGGGFGTSGENGTGTVGGAAITYTTGGAGLANGDATLVPLAGGSGGAGGDSGGGGGDGAGGGGGGGGLLLAASSIVIGEDALFAAWGGDGGNTVGANPGSSTGGAGGSGGGVFLAAAAVHGLGADLVSLNGGRGGHELNGYYSGDGGEGRLRVDGGTPGAPGPGPTAASASTWEGPAVVSIVDTELTISSSGTVTLYIHDASGYVTDLALLEDDTVTLYPSLAEGMNYLTLVDDTAGVMSPAGTATIDYRPDIDGDGHLAPRYGGDDCDDTDADVSPSAPELCNGGDDDCDGDIDEDSASDAPTWYTDGDGDGYGDAGTGVLACDAPIGTVADASDCDDASTLYHPGAEELDCADPADYNCDGSVLYADADADGWAACEDCDDANPLAAPDGVEVCDGADNDCDTLIDEDDATDALNWYADGDGDGYGDALAPTLACSAPAGTVADATDCDDASAMYHPGADEADCTDPADYNCDGSVGYADVDADGWAACADCDDDAAAVNPDAAEACNEIDDDCDAEIDEGLAATWYADADGDSYGDAGAPVEDCAQPQDAVADDTDCDDADADVYPGATEIPGDGVDQDCVDGDEALPGDDTGDDTDDGVGEDTGDGKGVGGGGGCGCATPGLVPVGAPPGASWALGLGALALLRRRRATP